MTLNLMLINQGGVWQSSDFRLTDPRTSAVKDDFSVKHVAFRCRDGAALLAYCGAGSVSLPRAAAAVHLSDWIRQIVRGESLTLDETFTLIRERATADLGELLQKMRLPHMFSIGAFLDGAPWAIQIRNFEISPDLICSVRREFQTVACKVEVGAVLWVPPIISEADQRLMLKVMNKRPRKPKEFSDLLAGVNLRVSKRQASVSSHCMSSYLPPTLDGVQTIIHANGSQTLPDITSPFLLFGIDMTEQMRVLASMFTAKRTDTRSEEDRKDDGERMKKAAQLSVITKNPLKS
jgi:hypothetical protein